MKLIISPSTTSTCQEKHEQKLSHEMDQLFLWIPEHELWLAAILKKNGCYGDINKYEDLNDEQSTITCSVSLLTKTLGKTENFK